MAVQDRNVHRDSDFARSRLVIPLQDIAGGAANRDVPFFAIKPRYNARITDLYAHAQAVATTAMEVRALSVPNLYAAGEVAAAAAAAATFALEAFWQNDDGVLTPVGATAAQAFTSAFTVVDGGWGVVTVQIDGSQTITTKTRGPTQNYATEALALANAPAPDAGNGVVCVITIEASGADFVAGTDDTDTANSFNTWARIGHQADLAVSTGFQTVLSTRASRNKDYAGGRLLDVLAESDLIVLTGRSAGASDQTNGFAVLEFRPFPLQGEGRANLATGRTTPQVP